MLQMVGGSVSFRSNIINLEITSPKCAYCDYCSCKVNERKLLPGGQLFGRFDGTLSTTQFWSFCAK